MIRDYETETGSVYRIDHENRVWTKIEKHADEPENDSYVAPLNQLWQGPYENRFSQDGWNEVEFPSVGMSMYIFGKMGYSWCTTDVVNVSDVDSWRDPVERIA